MIREVRSIYLFIFQIRLNLIVFDNNQLNKDGEKDIISNNENT